MEASHLQVPPPESAITIQVHEERKTLPAWVNDPEESELVWNIYREYLGGRRAHEIGQMFGVSTARVYKCIEWARAELPFATVSRTYELVEARRSVIMRGLDLMAEVMASEATAVRKADSVAKLLSSLNPYYTATEQLLGFKQGERVSIQNNQGGQMLLSLSDMRRRDDEE